MFPRKTKATPDDDMAFTSGPGLFQDPVDQIHISVSFVEDIPYAEHLALQWGKFGNVSFGGPAFGEPSGEFTPGMYLKKGYTITSRGCPNKCWFCSVWKREGQKVKELQIKDGWILQDDNLLACSENHIHSVVEMLSRQGKKIEFSGGLAASLLKPWHVELFSTLKLESMMFAYDTPDDYEPLLKAGKLLSEAGITIKTRIPRCYVLCGYKGDTFAAAEKRMWQTVEAGFIPRAMRYQGKIYNEHWKGFARSWFAMQIVMKKISNKLKATCS